MIYFDNAATSLHRPAEVAKAVLEAMETMGSPGRGVHGFASAAAGTVFEARLIISELFNVGDPQRVVFTYNATASLNMVIQGCLEPGDHCITSQFEHNSVLRPLYHMEKNGVEVERIGGEGEGVPQWGILEQLIRENTKMVVVGHGSNVTGNLADLKVIGDICRKHQILMVVDAAQTAGLIPIDLLETGIHALCMSGHKGLLAPQGVGVLALGPNVKVPPLLFGGTGIKSHDQDMPDMLPEALEAGTMNTHGIAGLVKGCEYLMDVGLDKVYEGALALARRFWEGVRSVDGIRIYGDYTDWERLPTVSLNLGDADAAQVSDLLAVEYGIATRPGAHCAPGVHSYFGTERQGMVRFSFSHFNTEEEVDQAIRAIRALAQELL